MRLFSPRPTLSDQDIAAGMRWLTWEGAASIGFGNITGSGFLAAYALILGANNFQIGILAALPFLAQSTQIFFISLMERLKTRKALAVITWALAQGHLDTNRAYPGLHGRAGRPFDFRPAPD